MFKEKGSLVHWICKFAGREKVVIKLLCVISAAVFVWVLYVGKVHNQTSLPVNVEAYEGKVVPPPPPPYFLGYTLPPEHPCSTFSLPPAVEKRTGLRSCPVCYLPVDEAIALMPKDPSFSPVVQSLTYIYEETLNKETEFGGSDFGGYPTLKQRDESYDIRESMNVHCGFVKGSKPGRGTGFDIDDNDLLEMEQCNGVVVVSAIFGAYDVMHRPKNISEYSNQTICFYMLVDEATEADLIKHSGLGESKKIGVWRIVVVHNLPYTDSRRNGRIPKHLTHRLFPNARYSMWIDGKLQLVVDPYQVLERFLWRQNATFAISRHYINFDVFKEAKANKAHGKYDNASIDFQLDFYKKEGLTPYSDAKLPITSDVPESCVIVREHVPISNLFSCLWFNEVDRFTPRDQLSFSTVRDRISARTNWTVSMFLDCERRNFVILRQHKQVSAQLAHTAPPIIYPPPPPSLTNDPPRVFSLETSGEAIVNAPLRKVSLRHGRDRRSGSRRHRKGGREMISS